METVKTLHEIGCECLTDKAGSNHFWRGQSYLHIYERYFSALRDTPIAIIEIGVRGGHSLRAWARYFPNAQIIGIDIDPTCLMHDDGERTRVIIGDQSKQETIDAALVAADDREIGIIIDDGSHLNDYTLKSFDLLWRWLMPGGLYVLEDMACTYSKDIVADMERGGWRWPYVNDGTQNDRGVIDRWLLNTIAALDHKTGDVRAVHAHCMTIVIEKVRK